MKIQFTELSILAHPNRSNAANYCEGCDALLEMISFNLSSHVIYQSGNMPYIFFHISGLYVRFCTVFFRTDLVLSPINPWGRLNLQSSQNTPLLIVDPPRHCKSLLYTSTSVSSMGSAIYCSYCEAKSDTTAFGPP